VHTRVERTERERHRGHQVRRDSEFIRSNKQQRETTTHTHTHTHTRNTTTQQLRRTTTTTHSRQQSQASYIFASYDYNNSSITTHTTKLIFYAPDKHSSHPVHAVFFVIVFYVIFFVFNFIGMEDRSCVVC